jgi:hypothetical protein
MTAPQSTYGSLCLIVQFVAASRCGICTRIRNDFERVTLYRDEIWDLQPFREGGRLLFGFRRDFTTRFLVLAIVLKVPISIRDVSN